MGELHQALVNYGPIAVFLGAAFEGQTAVIAGGFLAHQQLISLWLSLALATYYHPPWDPKAKGLNWCGQVGYYFADMVYSAGGVAGFLLPLLGGAWGAVLVARKRVRLPAVRLVAALCLVFSSAYLIEIAFGGPDARSNRLRYGPGGWMAFTSTPELQEKFGGPGLLILMTCLTLVSFLLATEMAFYPALTALARWLSRRRDERGEGAISAIFGWMGRLVLGLWDFLRGARIGASAERMLAQEAQAQGAELQPYVDPKKPASRRRSYHARAEDDDEDVPEFIQPPAPLRLPPSAEVLPGAVDEESEEDALAAGELAPSKGHDEDEFEVQPQPSAGVLAQSQPEQDDDAQDLPVEIESKAARKSGSQPVSPTKKLELGEETETGADAPELDPTEWVLPPVELLDPPERVNSFDNKTIEENARKLEHVLRTFRVEAQVVNAQSGPTVVLYELEVAQGTRMNKVQQLGQEIAAALRAQSVRIIAPIPGKSTVGIEVPSKERRVVRISELVNHKGHDPKSQALPLYLGVDVEGHPIVEDLARMPHLLIAGTTGSGKSVCINTILASVLLTRSPHDAQLILIDPKMVELQVYTKVPHLMLPVVSDMRQATQVLNWLVEKMEGRYELFQAAGVKHIRGYNQLGEEGLRARMGEAFGEERTPRHVPYIVVVIDEFADLMMQSKKEAELAITRLAQKSRAVGIHVILATQRPSTDVITGVIKGNLPTRIAFQVASKIDSRVILDVQGAEKLLGGGDMLYTPPSSGRVKRAQGALVTDAEIQDLVDFVCQHSTPRFSQELVQVATGSGKPGGGEGFESALEDDLWDDAVRVILKSKRGSASLLQRALGVGYTRASRLLDMMGEAGIVSDHKGSKAREVLMTLEQWEEQHGASLNQAGPGASDDP